ncbi:hypothetical protein BH23ACT11_BH23ACT11_20870 [soil metagenome]
MTVDLCIAEPDAVAVEYETLSLAREKVIESPVTLIFCFLLLPSAVTANFMAQD